MLNLPPSRFHISTFATKLGVRNIAFLGSGLLILNYIGAVVAAIYMPQVGIAHIFSLMYSFCLSFFVNSHYMLLRLLDVAWLYLHIQSWHWAWFFRYIIYSVNTLNFLDLIRTCLWLLTTSFSISISVMGVRKGKLYTSEQFYTTIMKLLSMPYADIINWILFNNCILQEAIAEYYRFIWNLFYAEYIIFPFIWRFIFRSRTGFCSSLSLLC